MERSNQTPKKQRRMPPSRLGERRRRQQLGRILLLAIIATVAILILVGATFGVCLLIDRATPDTPNDQAPGDSGNSPSTGLTPPEYEMITQLNSAIHKGNLIIVNKQYAYVFPANDADLQNIVEHRAQYQGNAVYGVGLPSWKLRYDTLEAFNQMMLAHYKIFGTSDVAISSAYRTYEEQAALSSFPAGYSDHHTGFCVALKSIENDSDHWIYQNCHKYGFVVRYPQGKESITEMSGYGHCFRYVGIPHASYITENNLCMEEYTELIKNNYTSETPLEILAADGHRYAVYYTVVGSGDITMLKVPKNYTYSISGDNIGGFIVTVHLDEPKNA